MTRDEVTRAVRERVSGAAGWKSRGGGKGQGQSRPRPPIDARPRRATNRVKVRVEATAKPTLGNVVAALRASADRLEEDLAPEAA